jgi:hypothetical protein
LKGGGGEEEDWSPETGWLSAEAFRKCWKTVMVSTEAVDCGGRRVDPLEVGNPP